MSYSMRAHVQASPATLLAVVTVGVALTGVAVVLAAGRAAGTLPGVPEPERLLHVQEVDANGQVWPRGSSVLWRAIQDIPDVDVAAVRYLQAHLSADGTTMIVAAAGVSDGFFETMAAQPALGRTPRHARAGGDEIVVSRALWQQLAINPFVPTTVLLDGIAHTIVGVMPEGFDMPGGRDLWVRRPAAAFDALPAQAKMLFLAMRARAGTSARQAVAALEARVGNTSGRLSARPIPVPDERAAPLRAPLRLALAGALLLVGIAAANYILALVAVQARRRHAHAVKLALGASRARLAVEAMVGPIVQCLLVSTAAALAAPWLVEHVGRLLSVRVFAHAGAPLASVPSVVAVAMGGGIGAVAGLAAYLTVDGASRSGLDVMSKRQVASVPRGVRWLLAVQVTVAIALVSAAVVLVRSVRQAESEPLGFRTDGVVVAPTTLPAWRYQDDETRARAAAALLAAVRRETGAPVAVATVLPIGDATPVATVRAAGTEREAGAVLTSVSTEYFQVLGIRVDEGRAFAAADTAGDAEPVVVIDRRLAQALWPDRSPLGRHVDLLGIERRVIGVASSTKQFSLTSDPRPAVYVPFAQAPASSFSLVAALPAAAAGSLSGSLRAVEPDLVVEPVVSMAAVVDSTLEQRRIYSAMSVGISVLAVTSALAGTFGLATLLIGARRRASAIMLAVGASPWRVALSAATPFAVPVCVGLAAGVLMTVALASRLDPFLYRTTMTRPDVMAVAGAAVATVLALGMLGPVWRVVSVNAAEVLRLE